MRLNEFDTRIYGRELSKEDIIEACLSIKENCSNFVYDMKKASKFLYRGVDGINPPVFTKTSPWNRKPIGQSQSQQETLDNILKLGGFKSLRSNSICCTSNEYQIEQFGIPYMIFPKNGYSFTWSSKIEDIGSNNKFAALLFAINTPDYKKAMSVINTFEFKNTDMSSALESENEITIHGEYMAISAYYRDIISNYFKIVEGK